MELAKTYLVYALTAGLLISFLMLMWEFIWRRQWQMALLSIFFSWACGGGFLIALIFGWQEAENWKIKKLMRVYTILFVICVPIYAKKALDTAFTARPEPEAKSKAKTKPALKQSL